jgi:hypothetical protein
MTVWLLLIMYTSNGQQLAYTNVYASAAVCERNAKDEIAVHRALDPTYRVTSNPPYCKEVPVRER